MIVLVNVYFTKLIFQTHKRKIFKLFNTALILATKNGNIEIVKLLIEREGIDINATDVLLF